MCREGPTSTTHTTEYTNQHLRGGPSSHTLNTSRPTIVDVNCSQKFPVRRPTSG